MNYIHGQYRSVEHACWRALIDRCCNPNSAGFKNYGGRGISVCARWRKDFRNFLADMGRRPSKRHSIHRINNDRGYSPSNCEWTSDRKKQLSERRTSGRQTHARRLLLKRELHVLKKSLPMIPVRIPR